jgi:glycosyltransferase involved in cell wall biosynthesis
MRIAMFTETFLPGTDGIVTRLCATLQHLEREGHEVLLFTPDGAPDEYACAKIVGMPAMPFFLYPEKRFSLPLPRIRKKLLEFRPDLIHVVNPAFLGLGGIYYARRYRIPLVASYHTNVPGYARHYHLNFLEPALWWYFRTLHNRAELNLCTSRATQSEVIEHGIKRVSLWERGVDFELYEGANASQEMRNILAPDATLSDKILLYVGRLASEKGIEKLKPILDETPNIHLAIVGDGPYRSELERVFTGSRTKFVGYLHGDELARAYASADGFVFPSTTETLGLVLFEAMAAGLPVIAADSPPTREVLEEGKAGFIFDSLRPESILQAVHSLFSDEEKRKTVQNRGREIAATLDWGGPTQQLISHYQAVLAHQGLSSLVSVHD